MNNNKINLELDIGTSLYKNLAVVECASLLDYSTYNLLDTKLELSGYWENMLSYKVIKNKHNILMIEAEIEDTVKIITTNNDINSVIINMDHYMDLEQLSDIMFEQAFTETDSKLVTVDRRTLNVNETKNHWETLIEKIYHKINSLETYKECWKLLEIEEYSLNINGTPVKMYGKKSKKGNTLLGFNINSSYYNYFTKEVIDATKLHRFESHNTLSNILNNYLKDLREKSGNNKSISKFSVTIYNKKYNINLNDRLESTLRIYSDICSRKKTFNSKDVDFFRVDNFILRSNVAEGITAVIFKKQNIPNVYLEDNKGNVINLEELLTKIDIMGPTELDTSYYNNIQIYNYIPTHLGLTDRNNGIYDYTIQLI